MTPHGWTIKHKSLAVTYFTNDTKVIWECERCGAHKPGAVNIGPIFISDGLQDPKAVDADCDIEMVKGVLNS